MTNIPLSEQFKGDCHNSLKLGLGSFVWQLVFLIVHKRNYPLYLAATGLGGTLGVCSYLFVLQLLIEKGDFKTRFFKSCDKLKVPLLQSFLPIWQADGSWGIWNDLAENVINSEKDEWIRPLVYMIPALQFFLAQNGAYALIQKFSQSEQTKEKAACCSKSFGVKLWTAYYGFDFLAV